MGELTPRFDGFSIDQYAGRFLGAFELETEDAEGQTLDEEAYFVVRTKVTGAMMKETKHGDLLRTNVYQVSDVVRVPSDVGFKLQTVRAAQLSFNTGLLTDEELNSPDGDQVDVD